MKNGTYIASPRVTLAVVTTLGHGRSMLLILVPQLRSILRL
jgi:hypothetical protein